MGKLINIVRHVSVGVVILNLIAKITKKNVKKILIRWLALKAVSCLKVILKLQDYKNVSIRKESPNFTASEAFQRGQ